MNVGIQWRVQLTDAIIDDSYSYVHLASSMDTFHQPLRKSFIRLQMILFAQQQIPSKKPMRISMRVVIAPTMVLTGWFAWANPF